MLQGFNLLVGLIIFKVDFLVNVVLFIGVRATINIED